MAKFFFFVFALCIAQGLGGRVVREEPASQNVLEDLSKQANAFLTDLGTQVNQVVNAKDSTELQAIFKTNTDTFVGKVTDLTKDLQEKLGSTTGDVNNVFGQVIAKLNQTVAELQAQHPDATAKAKEVQENLQKSLQTVLGEADKVAKTVAENSKGVQDDISKLAKQAYDQVLQTAQSLQKQLHDAANKS